MSGPMVLLLVVMLGDNALEMAVHEPTGRVSLLEAADDETMARIPETARILFMIKPNQVSARGLEQLGRLKQVEFLRINNSSHGDAALMGLAGHPSLRNLMMWSDSGVTAAGVQQLSTISSLRSLDFTKIPLSPEALGSMPTQLEALTINSCDIGDEGLEALPVFPRLRILELKGDDRITEAGLTAFIERHPRLENLAVDVASDGLLSSLEKLPLTTLWLSGPPVTAEGLEAIARLRSLERLTISSELSDDMVARIKQLSNQNLDRVAHKGNYIYLGRRRSNPGR